MLGRTRSQGRRTRDAMVAAPSVAAVPSSAAGTASVPARRPLFRPEVVAFQAHNRQWGRVVPLQPLSTRLLVWSVVIASACIIGFLAVAQYARKEVAIGYLTPVAGTARVFAPQPGIISAVEVKQGQTVSKGQPLLVVATGQVAGDGQDVNAAVLQTLQQQKQSLVTSIAEEVRRNLSEQQRLTLQVHDLTNELDSFAAQMTIQRSRIALQQQAVATGAGLRAQGLVSELDQRHREEVLLEQQQSLISLNQQAMAEKEKLTETQFSLAQLPFSLGEKVRPLRDQLAATEQRIDEVNGRQSYIVRAPINGTISLLQASVGQAADPHRLQLQIVPNHSRLEARLFIPVSAIGFVEVGQNVRILYDAFPYQRFGTYRGRITGVSQTVLMDSDVVAPVKLREPVYTATVALDQPNITVHGRKIRLEPDMSLRADIILERRTLMDWIIAPLRHIGMQG